MPWPAGDRPYAGVGHADHGSIIAFAEPALSLAPHSGIEMPSGLGGPRLPKRSSTARSPIPPSDNPERDHTMPFTPLPDDELVAWLLIHIWTLTTGKTLRCDVPPHELTEEELIDFWCDDHFDSPPISK